MSILMISNKKAGEDMKGLAYTYYQLKYIIKTERKNIIWAVLLATLFTMFCMVAGTKAYSDKMQQAIASKVIRFHVLANSDSLEDQNLKLSVRDAILQELGAELQQCATKEETEIFLKNSFDRIQKTALAEIKKQGYEYDIKVSLEKTIFPLKTYGEFSFPAGMYDALRVEIGTGKGQNWWCVMYPPMCYVDAAWSEVTWESKVRLKGTLTEEEFSIVNANQEGLQPKVHFKIVEWWQERK